jgi:hypothetical protein
VIIIFDEYFLKLQAVFCCLLFVFSYNVGGLGVDVVLLVYGV